MLMKVKKQLRTILRPLTVGLLAVSLLLTVFNHAGAAELKLRSVRLSTSIVGSSAQHNFTFTVPSTVVIGSLSFEYCTNSPLSNIACIPPVGLDLTSMSLASQTGNTGFNISVPDSTSNKIVLNRVASAGNAVSSTYNFTSIINPTTVNETTYVRIATYISTDATGLPTDEGAVAFAVTQNFQVDAYVPPFLIFCAGVTVTLNCSGASGVLIDIGELQETLTSTATMQFSGATNDATGYTTYLNGFTMTSGNNIINPLSPGGASLVGTSQFGLNLRANNSPTVGIDPFGPGSSAATVGYNTPNVFRFISGEAITNSPTSTDFKIFTASYIVNVPPDQTPGIYATTMTFTAIASF
jgi:hypothetical protein